MALIAGFFGCAGNAFGAFEMGVTCGQSFAGFPSSQVTEVNQDQYSRYVYMSLRWAQPPANAALGLGEYGMEFKTYQYNYDNAEAKGLGPAYIIGPAQGYASSDLPGFYVDSDFLSSTNAVGEYTEPQIGFGIFPEYGSTISTTQNYYASTRGFSGRGNSSAMKVRNYLTKRVADIGVSGVFLCQDIPFQSVIEFPQRIYSPSCTRTQLTSQVLHSTC